MSDYSCPAYEDFKSRLLREDGSNPLAESFEKAVRKWMEDYKEQYEDDPLYAEMGYWVALFVASLLENAENNGDAYGFMTGFELGKEHGKALRDLHRREAAN